MSRLRRAKWKITGRSSVDAASRTLHFSISYVPPRNAMPLYTAKVLPDADVADIYAWVQTLPRPAKVDSIPLLK